MAIFMVGSLIAALWIWWDWDSEKNQQIRDEAKNAVYHPDFED